MSARKWRANARKEIDLQVWNAGNPIGTAVRYWRGHRDGEGIASRTRSEAWLRERKATVAWDGEWSNGYRARVLVVETEHDGKNLVLETCNRDALGGESWRPWPSAVPDMPCALIEAVDALAGLVRHCWIHSGYRDCGYQQMTTAQKWLYTKIRDLPEPDELLAHLLEEEDPEPDPPASYGEADGSSSFGSDP